TPSPANVITRAAAGDAAPRGIGLPGFVAASRGASTRSLSAPIEACRPSIATARRREGGGAPGAGGGRRPGRAATRSGGEGGVGRPGRGAGSDVDGLREVREEVVDQAAAAVRDPGAEAGDERVQGHRRDDEVPATVASESRGRATTGSEHPFEFRFAQLRGAP